MRGDLIELIRLRPTFCHNATTESAANRNPTTPVTNVVVSANDNGFAPRSAR